MTKQKISWSVGTTLRILGGGLLIFGMLLQVGLFSIPSLRPSVYLIMAVGLLIYVVGLFVVKNKNISENND